MKKSNLFYQSRARRPEVERAEGIYIYGKNGERYIDGSSGAMVSNIGHSNPNVLKAMKAQMGVCSGWGQNDTLRPDVIDFSICIRP